MDRMLCQTRSLMQDTPRQEDGKALSFVDPQG